MRETAEIGKIPLGQLEVMSALNHDSDNLGNGFDLIDVLSNFRIRLSDMVLVISPGCHAVSPLSGNPIVALSFGLLDFAAWCFLRFLPELVKENIGIIPMVEVQHSIVPRSKFPYAIFQILGDVFA